MSGSRLCTMATASRPLLASPTIESSGQASFRRVNDLIAHQAFIVGNDGGGAAGDEGACRHSSDQAGGEVGAIS